ncbi:MAG: hypothetical protein GXP16_20155, partial [Gammaproteobacteria bacterium]|nr:hypothetical protein [Gammaproteobacteria bacterium]
PAQVDPAGNPLLSQPLSVVFLTLPPAADGTLTATASDGSFTFQPVLNFVGVTSFTYAIFDNSLQSASGTVQIEVFALPVPGAPPNAGEVAVTFNLSNTPLEQSATVEPNVLVTMDDSGSMDWNFSMDMSDEQGRFPITNNGIANNNVRSRVYSYLWDLDTNTYGNNSGCCGRLLPSEASLPAGNDYEVWQGRSATFNAIYYNPQVTYEPWAGLDIANQNFADANPAAIRLDPTTTANLFDITTNHSYTASNVPNWAVNGNSGNVNVTGYYIPLYYEADGTLIEIRLANQPFAGGAEREDCAIATACSYAEEIDNFANWFQYYRSRGHVSKAAIGAVVADLQDIRVGYETINENVDEPIAEMNEYFWEGEKEELMDAIYSVNNNGSTPLRAALDRSGEILGCNAPGKACPALPAPEGICQQNYALLFSDGYWNQNATLNGNFDQDGAGVFDGGKYADDRGSTLADVAMHYYENDLFPAVADGVPVGTADINGAPAGTFAGTSATLHQHMKTYTIAFGVEGSLDIAVTEALDPTTAINWPDPNAQSTAKIDDLLHAAVNGRGRFLNAGDPQELQTAIETAFLEFTQAASSTSAAAFNSTSLRNGTLLYRGFYDLRNRTGELTATEVDINGVLAATPTWEAAERLDPSHAEGLLPSERVMVTYDAISNAGVAFQFSNLNANQLLTLNTAPKLDYLRGVRTSEEPLGNLRARSEFEGLLGDIVNSSPIFVGNPRGRNRDQAPYPISDLYSEFADDHASRPAVVYVGANDGMLHGFNAVTGVEMMTYIPNKIIDGTSVYSNKLDNFSSTFYLHDYYVDLSPRLEDVYMRPAGSAGKEWVTALVGGLGGGGKGYFALDVTDPAILFANETAAQSTVLWEFTDEDDTYPLDGAGDPIGGSVGAITDPLGNPVKDLGFALAEPIIAMSNFSDTDTQQHWVAVFGNGPNSTAGIATLFILYMDEGNDGWSSSDFVKITTDFGVPLAGEELEGYPNGLGKPAAVDIDLNGTIDYVYAGDRLGNLHRFDITDSNPSNWSTTRIFGASYTDGGTTMLQPILSKPTVVRHPTEGGLLVTFGTGSFITEEDGENTDIQSIYTIWDELGNSPPTANANTKSQRLVEQTITNVVDDSGADPVTRRILTSNPVDYESETGTPGTYGWYIDLDIVRAVNAISGAPNLDASGAAPPAPQFPGEKAIRRFIFRDGVLITTTVLPATNETACFGARPGAILVLDALTGGNPSEAIIDFNTDTYVDENDLITVGGQAFSAGLLFDYSDLDGALVDLSTLGGSGGTDFLFVSGGNDTVSYRIRDIDDDKTGRLSWTQIIED